MPLHRIKQLKNASSSSTSNDSAPRVEGQRIKAKCEGWSRYFDGEITRVNSDGTYDILFDDGESKSGVKGSQIHDLEVTPAVPPPDDSIEKGSFSAGDRVIACCDGWTKWFPGEINRVHSAINSYDINFDDGERKKKVPVAQIRGTATTHDSAHKVHSSYSRFLQLAAMAKDFSGRQFFQLFDNNDSGIVLWVNFQLVKCGVIPVLRLSWTQRLPS